MDTARGRPIRGNIDELLVCLINFHQAFAPIRRDIRKLEEGFSVWEFFDVVHAPLSLPQLRLHWTAKQIVLHGALATSVADSVQQNEHCRHLGNKANSACRSCLILKADRVNMDLDLWDFKMLRRRDQTNVIADQISTELDAKFAQKVASKHQQVVRAASRLDYDMAVDAQTAEAKLLSQTDHENRLKKIRRDYGTREDKDIWESLTFDPHFQCLRCADHLFDFGLERQLLGLASKTMTAEARAEWSQRCRFFPWTSSCCRITCDLTETVTARYSMLLIRKMVLVSICTLDGLISDAQYRAICDLFVLRNQIFSSVSHTEASLSRIRQQLQTLIRHVSTAFGQATLDRPNWHTLIEFVVKDLSIMKSVFFGRTQIFERFHQSTQSLFDHDLTFIRYSMHRW